MRVRTCRNIKQTGSLFSMRKIKLKVRYIKRACYKNILLMSENLVIYYPEPLSTTILLLRNSGQSVIPKKPLLVCKYCTVLVPLAVR